MPTAAAMTATLIQPNRFISTLPFGKDFVVLSAWYAPLGISRNVQARR